MPRHPVRASSAQRDLEDFVEGLQPVSDADGNVRYAVKAGVFKRLCRRAQQDPAHTYALVIDEINRGNISKVCRPDPSASRLTRLRRVDHVDRAGQAAGRGQRDQGDATGFERGGQCW
jgi:hypothetical protein